MSYNYIGRGAAQSIVDILNAMKLKIAANRSDMITEVDQAVAEAETRLKALVGTPLTAATASAMTDQTKIYVYTGNETGYVNGNWYYHDGTNWVSGGVYNSVAFETDKTLSISDMAADAKVAGDEIGDVKNALIEFSGLTAISMLGEDSPYHGQYIKTNVNVGTVVSLTPLSSAGFRYAIVSCQPGDAFLINATGGGAPRVWAFIDSENVLLSNDNVIDHTVTNLTLVAPENSAYLIINDKSGRTSYSGIDRVGSLEQATETLSSNLISYTGGAYVTLPSDADLNEYTTPGNYVAPSNAISGMSNLPPGLNRQFRLTVRKSGLDSGAYIVQTLYPIEIKSYSGSIEYAFIRMGRTNGISSAWSGIPTSALASNANDGLMKNWDKQKFDIIEDYTCFEKPLYPSFEGNVSDLLKLEKTNCCFHDNFYRADNATEIGNNGSRTEKYLYSDMKPYSDESQNIAVGINDHKAVAINPNNVPGDTIRIKYKAKHPSVPYKVIMSFDGMGVLAISPVDTSNYLYVSATKDAFTVGGVGSFSMEPVTVTHNLDLSTIVVYVYATEIRVYVAGQKRANVAIELQNMFIGLLFRASDVNNIAYTNFDIFNSAENLYAYQDEGIEQANAFSDAIVNNSGTADYSYGILLDNTVTKNSLQSIRFEQRKADSHTVHRSEITVKNPRGTTENDNRPLQTKIFEYDMYLPEDYAIDRAVEILWQMHHTPDGVVADGLIPPIAFGTENGHFVLEVRSFDFKAQSSDAIIDRHTYDLGEYTPGKWYHFVVFIREGYLQEHDPCLAIWIDGELVHYKREPNAYNTTNGAYLKMGVYKPSYVYSADTGTTKRVVYIDNLYCWM